MSAFASAYPTPCDIFYEGVASDLLEMCSFIIYTMRHTTSNDAPTAGSVYPSVYLSPSRFLHYSLLSTLFACSYNHQRQALQGPERCQALLAIQRLPESADPPLRLRVGLAVNVVDPISRRQRKATRRRCIARPVCIDSGRVAVQDVGILVNNAAGRVPTRAVAAVLVHFGDAVVHEPPVLAQHHPPPLPILHKGACMAWA